MEEILTTTETTETAMTELEMLEQINNNLVILGNLQNLILGALLVIILYGMYKIAINFFGSFLN